MAVPIEQPIVCPIVIGRDLQLASLSQLLEAATSTGQTALISGEAGIGKSRLVSEIKAKATSREMRVLQGNCFEQDRPLPYAPVLDILRSFLAGLNSEEVRRILAPNEAEFVRLLPELRSVIPTLPQVIEEADQEKRRLFYALERLLIRLSASQPLLLVVEDLHWSDDLSLEFLFSLSRRLREHQVLVLLTYRSEEVNPALRHFLAELDRERLATEFVLKGLSTNEVDAMLRAILGQSRPTRTEFLDAIAAITEGNPFFIEEVLKSLVATGGISYTAGTWDRKPISELNIPRSIQDALQRRWNKISPSAQNVLTLAAVTGRRFDFDLLLRLTKQDEADLLRLVKELIAAQLVIEESEDEFAFRHALTRQAVYAGLLARERRGLHRFIAETLEGIHANALNEHSSDLAYHFYEAGVWEKALEYGRRAGERAQELYAPHAALEHYNRAIEASNHVAIKAPALHRARAAVYETLGDFDRARSDYQAALELAREAKDQQAEWQTLLDLGLLWAGRDYGQTREYYEKALALARELVDHVAIAHSLNWIGNWHTNIDQPRPALQLHQEALTIFRELNEPRGLARTLDLLAMTSCMSGDLLKGTEYYERAIALFRQMDDRRGLVSSLATLPLRGGAYHTDTVVAAASLAESIEQGEAALRMSREIGWRSAESYALWNLAMCYGPQGEYERAFAYDELGLAVAQEIAHRQWTTASGCVLGNLSLDLLALTTAQQQLEPALALANELGSGHWIGCVAGALASTLVQQKELAEAERVLSGVLQPDKPMQTLGQRQLWAASAELALAELRSAEALAIIDRLIASASNVSPQRVIPRLWKLHGEALAQLGRESEAEADFKAALARASWQRARSWLWRIHLALARLYQAIGRREEAQREYEAARAIIEALAANVPDEALRETFIRETSTMLPRVPSPSPRRVAQQAYGGLTEREREVAALVAKGKSNRDIAEQMIVSERTVETHVSNILSKLGFASRAQIAAWAVERGLTST